MTKFSILMPSYNYERFIVDATASVLNQKVAADVELVIQDGLSSDDTVGVVNRQFKSSHVQMVSEEDGGQSDALNKALTRSKGDIIGWLNADEFYLPGALEEIQRLANKFPKCEVFIGDCIFVDALGNFIRLRPAHRFSLSVLRSYGCFVSSCATFIRREALPDSPWDVTLRRTMDWDLWLTLGRRRKFRYVRRPLAAFRVHDDQITNIPEAIDYEEFERLADKHGFSRSPLKRLYGSVVHKFLKLIDGAYVRQAALLQIWKGSSLRWWEGPDLSDFSRKWAETEKVTGAPSD
jgi:glycosyltransferase involved in cell wall biosynthesis